MEISYELAEKDFREAYVAHRNRNALSRWSRRLFIWLAGFFAAFVIFGFAVKPSVEAAKNLFPFLGLVLMWIAALWIFPGWNMRRQFLKQPGAHGPRTLLLDSSGAHWRWNGGSSEVEWRNYIRSVEGKNQFLLYTSPACFNIVPKRALVEAQLEELRQILKLNIPASR